MSSRPVRSLLAAQFALVALLSACGGGGGGSDTPTPPPPPPPPPPVAVGTAGVYDINYGGFGGPYVFLEDGRFYGLHFAGSTLLGHPRGPLSSADATTHLESIAWANFVDDARQVGANEPAGMFGRTFSTSRLDVAIDGSMGSFHASATTQKAWHAGDSHTIWNDPIALSTLAGTYSGRMRSVGVDWPQQAVSGLVLGADGHFTATVAGCTFDGTLVPHGTSGVFEAQATTTGSGCGYTAPLAGIALPTDYSGNVPTLAIELDTADASPQTAVFIVTRP